MRQRGFGLGQPEGHVHGAVQLDGGGQGGASLLLLTDRGIQWAEAPVAVGLERAHAQLSGQGEGLPVVDLGLLDLRGFVVRGDLTEQAQSIGLVSNPSCSLEDL